MVAYSLFLLGSDCAPFSFCPKIQALLWQEVMLRHVASQAPLGDSQHPLPLLVRAIAITLLAI